MTSILKHSCLTLCFCLALVLISLVAPQVKAEPLLCPALLDSTQLEVNTAEAIDLCQFAGQPLIILSLPNTCDFSTQFNNLDNLHVEYGQRGLIILGLLRKPLHQPAQLAACYSGPQPGLFVVAATASSNASFEQIFTQLRLLGAPALGTGWQVYVLNAETELQLSFDAGNQPSPVEFKSILEKLLN